MNTNRIVQTHNGNAKGRQPFSSEPLSLPNLTRWFKRLIAPEPDPCSLELVMAELNRREAEKRRQHKAVKHIQALKKHVLQSALAGKLGGEQ